VEQGALSIVVRNSEHLLLVNACPPGYALSLWLAGLRTATWKAVAPHRGRAGAVAPMPETDQAARSPAPRCEALNRPYLPITAILYTSRTPTATNATKAETA
jgi:hypothetical protein